MKTKKLLATVLVIVMSVMAAMPAYAQKYYLQKGKNVTFPCWIWNEGYCYYFKNAGTMLKSTTTPDGYQVDEEGRWVKDGVLQTNGFDHYQMGIADYNGKDYDGIWASMREKLEGVFKTSMPLAIADGNQDNGFAYMVEDNGQSIDFDGGVAGTQGSAIWVTYNERINHDSTIWAQVGPYWSDIWMDIYGAKNRTAYAGYPDVIEKTIKSLIGDNAGQELFDYIRPHADLLGGPGYRVYYDENGNVVHGYTYADRDGVTHHFVETPLSEGCKYVYSDAVGDNARYDTLDWSAWQDRTTDYGKRFSVSSSEYGGDALEIKIY